MDKLEPKTRPQTLASQVIEANAVAVLEAFKDKRAIPALAEIAKVSFFLHQMAAKEAEKKKFARTVAGTRTDFYDRKITPPGTELSPRALRRAKRQTEINGISIRTQEALSAAGIKTLGQVLLKGTEHVDIRLLETISGIGKTRIEEIEAFAAKCFEI